MGTEQAYDIAIVGGGMAGLSLAQLMSQHLPDLQICLIDKFPLELNDNLYQPSFDHRSTAISRDSADIFDRLGLWQSIGEHATAIRRVHVSDRGHMGSTSYSENDNDGEPLGYVVDNAWLGRSLAKGVIEQSRITRLAPANVSSLKIGADGATLSLEAEQNIQIKCQLVVIADGANSSLRNSLGIATESFDYQQAAIIANVAFEKPHLGVAYERFTDTGPVALLPLGESDDARTSSLVWTTPNARLESALAWTDEQFAEELQTAFGYRLGKFTRIGERFHYPLKRMLAKEQVRSSVVLMGNAAHSLHPVAGQGFNLALRDAERLTSTIAQYRARGESLGSLAMLKPYIEKQQSDQWLTSMISHGFNRVFSDQRLVLQGARNLALIGLNLNQGIKKTFFDQMMGKGSLSAS